MPPMLINCLAVFGAICLFYLIIMAIDLWLDRMRKNMTVFDDMQEL